MEKCITRDTRDTPSGISSVMRQDMDSYKQEADEHAWDSERLVGAEHDNAACASPLLRAFSTYLNKFHDVTQERDSSSGAQI